MKKMMEKIKKNNKGFTLVELIVVIAVLAVITVVIAPQYIKYVEKSRIGTDENAIGEIAHIAEVEYVELEARNKVSGTVELQVNCDATFSVEGKSGVGKDDLATAVTEMMGQYKTKSKAYANADVVITLDEHGRASWTAKSGNVAESGN